jgi:hypothetical protein
MINFRCVSASLRFRFLSNKAPVSPEAAKSAADALERLSALKLTGTATTSSANSNAPATAKAEDFRTWREKLGTPQQRATLVRYVLSAAVATAVVRYYYTGYTHERDVAVQTQLVEALDREQLALEEQRIAAVLAHLQRANFSDAELQLATRVLRRASDQLSDVERADDAAFAERSEPTTTNTSSSSTSTTTANTNKSPDTSPREQPTRI